MPEYKFIGCLPVCAHPEKPDLLEPFIDICQFCKKEMWSSSFKVMAVNENPDAILCCYACVAEQVEKMNATVFIKDITKCIKQN